jgi:aminodeoxyfutalosine synthase
VKDVLRQLKEAGLGSMPGGGAEVFQTDTRGKIVKGKANAKGWLNVHRWAHEIGLRTNATLLYGHIETWEDRINHLLALRELQDETGGFQVFIPLAFHPANTEMDDLPGPSGLTDMKVFAISRLMLDDFANIKAYWIMLGVKMAQILLSFGANDLDGTVTEETIYHMAGAETPQRLGVPELQRMIVEAGRIPVQRDTLYNELEAAVT